MDWDDLLNKPDSFPPESHTHSTDQITGLDTTLADMQAEITNLEGLIDATMDQLAFGGTWNAATGKIQTASSRASTTATTCLTHGVPQHVPDL